MDMSNNYFLLLTWFPFTMLNRLFCCSFCFIIKKSCLSVCEKTTAYCTAMCDMSLEREFNYLLYGISQVQIVFQNINERRLRNPTPNFRQVPPYKRSKKCKKAEYVHWPIGIMNQSKNITLLTIWVSYGTIQHSFNKWGVSLRLTVKTTTQSVIWTDTDIRLTVKITARSVIWTDTDIRLTVITTGQSVRIWWKLTAFHASHAFQIYIIYPCISLTELNLVGFRTCHASSLIYCYIIITPEQIHPCAAKTVCVCFQANCNFRLIKIPLKFVTYFVVDAHVIQ